MNNIVEATISILSATKKPLDSYQVARRVGCTPMQAGRALQELRSHGQVRPFNVGGDSTLAEEFALVCAA